MALRVSRRNPRCFLFETGRIPGRNNSRGARVLRASPCSRVRGYLAQPSARGDVEFGHRPRWAICTRQLQLASLLRTAFEPARGGRAGRNGTSEGMSGSVEKLWQRGNRYLVQGQLAPARAMLESMARLDAGDARTLLLRCNLLFAEDRLRDAAEAALAAAGQPMGDLALRLDAVDALLKAGETVAARACLANASTAAGSPADMTRAASQWQSLGEHAEALRLLEEMRNCGLDGQEVSFYRGVQYGFTGDLERAEAELQRSAQAMPPQGRAFVELARLRRQTPDRNHLDLLQQQLARVERGSENHAALQFALYKELEDLGRYDDAWHALVLGNAVMSARLHYDPEAERNLANGLIDACAGFCARRTEVASEGPRPIFVVGLPRSGTTLLERIMGNHSQVMSAGELPDFGLQLARCANR